MKCNGGKEYFYITLPNAVWYTAGIMFQQKF